MKLMIISEGEEGIMVYKRTTPPAPFSVPKQGSAEIMYNENVSKKIIIPKGAKVQRYESKTCRFNKAYSV